MVARFTGTTRYPMMFQGSRRPLFGVQTSKPNRGRLSVSKGTREPRPRRVIAWPGRFVVLQASPRNRARGGAAIVVGGRESRPQGEGRQEVSFWIVVGQRHFAPTAHDVVVLAVQSSQYIALLRLSGAVQVERFSNWEGSQ